MAGADLKNADLRFTTFVGTDLSDVNFIGAKVDAATFDGCRMGPGMKGALRERGARVHTKH